MKCIRTTARVEKKVDLSTIGRVFKNKSRVCLFKIFSSNTNI